MEVNKGSLSEIIHLDSPCNLNILLKYIRDNSSAFIFEVQGTKCACLVNVSTNVAMESYQSAMGKPDIKSMDIVSHGRDALGKGYKVPGGFVVLALIRWHVAHILQ